MDYRFSKPGLKVAAFDLDHTLIKPKGKNTFSKHRNDVMLLYPEVEETLSNLRKDGYKIVIFTNQRGVGRKTTLEEIYYKIDTYLPKGKTIDVFISYCDDYCRKPSLGMFDKFMELNGAIVDMYYVGDAAGRPGDFSASDRKFALNAGIPFYTPEQFFLKSKNKLPPLLKLKRPKPHKLRAKIPDQTVVVLVGPPGCGKSSFTKKLVEEYSDMVIVGNDHCGSASKSLTQFKKFLKEGVNRIIVDNTNSNIKARAVYSEPAKDHGYKVWAIVIDVTREHAEHLNRHRAYLNSSKPVPPVAYGVFYKNYTPPAKSEAFNKVNQVVPNYPRELFEYAY